MPTDVLQGNLILSDRVVSSGQLVVEDGRIAEVVEGARFAPTRDLGDGFVAPGFIDVHVHGVAGVDTMDASPAALALMASRFAAHGVTGFLPTTVTDAPDRIERAVACARAARDEAPDGARARVLGVHLEGPWLSRRFKGMHAERLIRPPAEEELRRLLAAAPGAIRIVTLAPELPGADQMIALLRAEGVTASIGHSAATCEEALAAVALGATHVTHCFNAMSGLHHRQPGVACAALVADELFTELIADGVHVHPQAMRLLVRAKGRERVLLVTDAMAGAERPDGDYVMGGQEVQVRGGVARLADGTLASSTLMLDAAVRTLVARCGVSLVDAVHMAATTPAAALGLGAWTGRLAPGLAADLALLDRDLRPLGIVRGAEPDRAAGVP